MIKFDVTFCLVVQHIMFFFYIFRELKHCSTDKNVFVHPPLKTLDDVDGVIYIVLIICSSKNSVFLGT